MAWFKKTRKPMAAPVKEKPSRVPEGLWVKCPGCAQVIYNKDLAANVNVCPKCGHQATEIMPTDACQFFYDCKGCGERLKPKPGDCCVFCSYGSVPCPPMQAGHCCS